MKTFWMLYVESDRPPSHKHATLGLAREEAKRLTQKTGKAVYLLQAVFVCTLALEVQWEGLSVD